MFSPYYAWAGRRDPENHCAVNVALYGRDADRWAMTERGRGALDRTQDRFTLGRSSLHWSGSALTITLDERATPHLTPIRGTVTLSPEAMPGRQFPLDPEGRHQWRPIAPLARIEVDLDSPETRWSGHGYLDANHGSDPLEAGFRRWDWSRLRQDGTATVLYDAERRDGGDLRLALRFGADGTVEPFTPPPQICLSDGFWGVRRNTRADTSNGAAILRVLEDSPFYTREVLETRLGGERLAAIHESLDLDRFAHPVVKLMLPFRMPRWTGRSN
ncbi:carotenoid 1,2-hydratase [Thalassobaculum sp. OXR-137]|uniref:carotenoid 1,2-hydratase n=1 Tax=Thalassobaculum sp. OXR-137 TaxID=3100173 RepID=UPI002AC9BCC5|nr:carotenoid 1,2-hydratase [Thalassobaculum sp. OXR-137]WPZ36804.1 carotenoid 1,2-hydratase [Thalassobaculum sp. OXR-137]